MESIYKIGVSQSKAFVILDFEGMITPEEMPSITREVDQMALDYNVFSFLIDLRGSRNMAPKKVNFDSGQVLPEGLIEMSKKKVAILIDPKDTSHDLIVLMMQSQRVNFRKFYDFTEAVKFLES